MRLFHFWHAIHVICARLPAALIRFNHDFICHSRTGLNLRLSPTVSILLYVAFEVEAFVRRTVARGRSSFHYCVVQLLEGTKEQSESRRLQLFVGSCACPAGRRRAASSREAAKFWLPVFCTWPTSLCSGRTWPVRTLIQCR